MTTTQIIRPEQLISIRDCLLLRQKVGNFAAEQTFNELGHGLPYIDAMHGAYNKGYEEALELLYAIAPSMRVDNSQRVVDEVQERKTK